MKNILFRADSSSDIGAGHIMRDLVLSKQFKNVNIIFATQELAGNSNKRIIEKGYQVIILESDKVDELIHVINDYKIDVIIIDHYNIDYKFEKLLKENTDVFLFSFDDTYNRHYCDVLLNQSIHADKSKYKALVGNNTTLLCGSEYILLNDKFYTLKDRKIENQQGDYILIALGGGDTAPIIYEILKAFPKDTSFKIVSPQFDELSRMINNAWNIEIITYTDTIAELMNNASLVICSLGMTFYEVLFLKKKYIAIQTVDNQNAIFNYLEDGNFPVFKAKDIFVIDMNNVLSKVHHGLYDKIIINPRQNFIQTVL